MSYPDVGAYDDEAAALTVDGITHEGLQLGDFHGYRAQR